MQLDPVFVSKHLHLCLEERLPQAQEALDFFYDLCEREGVEV
ncbi:MAG: hypothetical protein Q7S00_04800 [bacterium]|nr:hypothetical protein [bacterium]